MSESELRDHLRRMENFVPVKDITNEVDQSRFLIVGDIHGCSEELFDLLDRLEFDYDHSVLISVGDLTDRGPYSDLVLSTLLDGKVKRFYSVQGNHDDKLIRYCKGNNVKISHGLDRTLQRIASSLKPNMLERPEVNNYFKDLILNKLAATPYILKVYNSYIVHAGFNPKFGIYEQKKEDCLFMRYFGGQDYFDEVNGRYWADLWGESMPTVFCGHNVKMCDYIRYRSNGSILTCNLDGGCTFGGELRIYDSRDKKVHTIEARQEYSQLHS